MTRRAVTAALALVLAAASAALAFWPAAGTGSGTAGLAAGAAPLTIAPAAPIGALLPTGAESAGVAVTITNPNAFPVHVHGLELDTGQGDGGFSASAGPCALAFTPQDNGGAGWDVPAGASATIALPGSVVMGTTAADGCQGQSFSIYLRAT